MDLPDSNPKTVFGLAKPGIANIPPVAVLTLGQAMTNGAEKYGRTNWREHAVTASVYYDAIARHLMAWWDGEQVAEDSGVHHLGHAMAGLSILLDAEASGKLIDDRPSVPGQTADFVKRMTKPMEPNEWDEPNEEDEFLCATTITRAAFARALQRMDFENPHEWGSPLSETEDEDIAAAADQAASFRDVCEGTANQVFETMVEEGLDAAADIIGDLLTGHAFYTEADAIDGGPYAEVWDSRRRADVTPSDVMQAISALYRSEVTAGRVQAPINQAYRHIGKWLLAQYEPWELICLLFYVDCIGAGLPFEPEQMDEFLSDLGIRTPLPF